MPRENGEDGGNGVRRCRIGSETALGRIIFSTISVFRTNAAADCTAACSAVGLARRSRSGLTAGVTSRPCFRCDLADNTQTSFAAFRAGPVLCFLGLRALGGFSGFRLNRRSDLCQAVAPTTVGQEAEMSDPHEAELSILTLGVGTKGAQGGPHRLEQQAVDLPVMDLDLGIEHMR